MHCIETCELWLYTVQQKLHTRLLEQNLTDEHVCKSVRMPPVIRGPWSQSRLVLAQSRADTRFPDAAS